jgi:hypothetical protein
MVASNEALIQDQHRNLASLCYATSVRSLGASRRRQRSGSPTRPADRGTVAANINQTVSAAHYRERAAQRAHVDYKQ